MLYCDTHLRNQLIVSNLKINSFEIRDAIGFDNDWLTGLRLFFECCSRTEYERLPQLLDQAEQHNQLVAAIEPDIQSAANLALSKHLVVELNDVIITFSQTKRKILDAIATYNIIRNDTHHTSIENHTGVTPAALASEPSSQGYRNLIHKSLQLAIHV